MNRETLSIISTMRRYLEQPSAEVIERVRTFASTEVAAQLIALGVESEDRLEAVGHWDEFRRDQGWVSLLAALIVTVEDQRGRIDAPIGIWPDLPRGRRERTALVFLPVRDVRPSDRAVPARSRLRRFRSSTRRSRCWFVTRASTDERWGLSGVDAGWWMLVTLRGEIVQIQSLQFHRVNLGVGSLSPNPWYDDADVDALGVGFGVATPRSVSTFPTGRR